MNISKHVIERLEELTAQKPEPAANSSTAEASYVISIPVEDQNATVTLALEDYDRYSVLLRHIDVTCENPAANQAQPGHYLHKITEEMVRRLTYMEEPIAVVELEENEGLAQLRSELPRRDGEAIIYWEGRLNAQPSPRVRFIRYRWTPAQAEREAVLYPVTFARLGQIAEDLAQALLNN